MLVTLEWAAHKASFLRPNQNNAITILIDLVISLLDGIQFACCLTRRCDIEPFFQGGINSCRQQSASAIENFIFIALMGGVCAMRALTFIQNARTHTINNKMHQDPIRISEFISKVQELVQWCMNFDNERCRTSILTLRNLWLLEWNGTLSGPLPVLQQRTNVSMQFSILIRPLFRSRTHMLHIFTHTHMRLKWKVFDFRSRRVRYKARRLAPLWTQSKTGAFKITDLWLPRRERKTLSFVLLNFQKHFSEERPSGDWFRTWGERILRAEFLLCMQPSHLLN